MFVISCSNTFVVGLTVVVISVVLGPLASAGECDRADYGQRIEGVAGEPAVWWCEAAWKVAPGRLAPREASPAASLSAARNDREAVQIVVCPSKDLKRFGGRGRCAGRPRRGDHSGRERPGPPRVLPLTSTRRPTRPGVNGDWPDALPPLEQADRPAGRQEPAAVGAGPRADGRAGGRLHGARSR